MDQINNKKKIRVKKGIEELLKLRDSTDNEQVHRDADEILLEFVPEEVELAYRALRSHTGFWYA